MSTLKTGAMAVGGALMLSGTLGLLHVTNPPASGEVEPLPTRPLVAHLHKTGSGDFYYCWPLQDNRTWWCAPMHVIVNKEELN